MSKARITYRFDQKRNAETRQEAPARGANKVISLYQEEFQVIEEPAAPAEAEGAAPRASKEVESLFESHSLNTFTTDFGSWSSPIETESDRVERLIRDSQAARSDSAKKQAGYGPEPGDDHDVRPERPDEWSSWTGRGPWVEPGTGARYARSSGGQWFRIAASVAGAVVTGVAFGFLVLSMFSGSDGQEAAQAVTSPASNAQAAQAGAAGAAGAAGQSPADAAAQPGAALPSSAGAATPVQLAAKSYAFLQNGVFSTLQSAQTAQAGLKKEGLASALEEGEKLTVFVGFAANRDEALALSQQLKEKNLEVYIKNMDIPAVSAIRWSGAKPEAAASFLTEGDKLIGAIGGLTMKHLGEAAPTGIDDQSLQSIRAIHQSLTTLASPVSEGVSDELKPLVQKMVSAVNSSVQSMEEYKKNPSAAMLWQAQSSMMQYIIAQKQLLQRVAV